MGTISNALAHRQHRPSRSLTVTGTGEGQVGGHEKEAMGVEVPCAVCRPRCLGVWEESPTGDGARESGAKSGRVKSAATFGVTNVPAYLDLPDLPLPGDGQTA